MNRPDKLNSFTVEMWHEMRSLGEAVHDDPNLRAVVVMGEGSTFSFRGSTRRCSPAEPPTPSQVVTTPTRHADPTVDGILRTQAAYSWLADTRYPASTRRCTATRSVRDCSFALACDVRVFTRGTKVGLLEHKYGILPDLGGTQRLPPRCRRARRRKLI